MGETKKLTEEQIGWIIEGILNGDQIDDILKRVEFKSRRAFNSYLKSNPELQIAMEQAKIDSCLFVENDILHIHRIVRGDHKMARVVLDAKLKFLAFINPEKYGNKIDLNLKGTISIRGNLDASEKRIAGVIRDVTPIAAAVVKQLVPTGDETGP